MKKNFKSLLFMLLMGLSIIFIVACEEKNLSSEKVIAKITKAAKGIKSVNIELKYEIINKAANNTMEASSLSSVILEPFTMEVKAKLFGIEIINYIKDGVRYGYSPFSKKWEKSNIVIEDIKKEEASNLPFKEDFYEALKDNIDKVNVEKKEGHYILTLAESDFLSDIMSKHFNGLFTNVKITDFTFEYIVDEKTFLPITFNASVNTENELLVNIYSQYSKINEIKDIELPAEAKNAE